MRFLGNLSRSCQAPFPAQLEMCMLLCLSAHELISWLQNSTVVLSQFLTKEMHMLALRKIHLREPL